MKRSRLVAVAVARTSLIVMTAFTLAIAVRVVGSDLPPGHPPVDACPQLPPGHPPSRRSGSTVCRRATRR